MDVFRVSLLLAVTFSTACAAAVGVSGPIHVPADSLAQCKDHCSTMGMNAGAVVVMADNVGCVCEPQGATAASGISPSASLGAMAALVVEQQRQEVLRQQLQLQQQQAASATR